MRLENLLRGMTIPGTVPSSRRKTMTKHFTIDEKSLFVIQNLVGEIVRLNKLNARIKGIAHYIIFCEIIKFCLNTVPHTQPIY